MLRNKRCDLMGDIWHSWINNDALLPSRWCDNPTIGGKHWGHKGGNEHRLTPISRAK
jgi:hypothetical protein